MRSVTCPMLTPLPPNELTPASVLPVPSAWDTLLPGIRIAHLAQVSVQAPNYAKFGAPQLPHVKLQSLPLSNHSFKNLALVVFS